MYRNFSHRLQFRTIAPQYQRTAKHWPQMATRNKDRNRRELKRIDLLIGVSQILALGLCLGILIGGAI